MNNKEERITLDDVLDFYLASSEELGADTLTDMIQQYPQYENELREFAAFNALKKLTPAREHTDEEEELLNTRAGSIVQNLLYQKRQERESAKKAGSLSCLRAEIAQQYAHPQEFYQKTWLSEGVIWTLDDRQVIYQTIPHKAIERIADALGKLVSTVATYLQGEMQLASGHYKAMLAPVLKHKYSFPELIEMDEDLTEEQKAYWLAQCGMGSAGNV